MALRAERLSRRPPRRSTRLRWVLAASLLLHAAALFGYLLLPERPPLPEAAADQGVTLVFEAPSSQTASPAAPNQQGEAQPKETPSPAVPPDPTATGSQPAPATPPTAPPQQAQVAPPPERVPPPLPPLASLEPPVPRPAPPLPAPPAPALPAPTPPAPPDVRINPPGDGAEPPLVSLPPPVPIPVPPAPPPAPPVPPREPPRPAPRPPPVASRATPPGTQFANPVILDFGPSSRPPPPARAGRGIDLTFTQPRGNTAGGSSRSNLASDMRAPGADPDWLQLLRGWVEAHKYYPSQAAERGEDGSATVTFTVDRDGRVTSVDLVSRSGSVFLDAAWLSVFRGARVPPLPPDARQVPQQVTYTMHFILVRR